jgi:hypothetical protein
MTGAQLIDELTPLVYDISPEQRADILNYAKQVKNSPQKDITQTLSSKSLKSEESELSETSANAEIPDWHDETKEWNEEFQAYLTKWEVAHYKYLDKLLKESEGEERIGPFDNLEDLWASLYANDDDDEEDDELVIINN